MTGVRTLALGWFLSACAAVGASMQAAPAGRAAPAGPEAEPARGALLGLCEGEHYRFTPALRRAFLAYAKAQALSDLKQRGVSLPADLLGWVEADPIVEASVYGAHDKPAEVLMWLASLRMDLGRARFEKYRQLALATAIVQAKLGANADLTPRGPLTLKISGDPRKPVNTKDPNRPLDMNDHIINFLNENTVEEEVVVGYKQEAPELKYDRRGIAIPQPKPKGKSRKVPVTEKRTRTLYAADVLASPQLQAKFNAYMKARGYPVKIDCGDHVIHWKSRDMVRGEQRRRIGEAFALFRKAYEAKGLLPAQRDPVPTPAERCAYLIRNNEHVWPAGVREQRKWPRFPLTAPWPVLTLLVADSQPLREREERWVAFRDKGEFRRYGEYIGPIAQQFDMQSARRLCPYPFQYGSIQMMLKDGGVCGTMAAISARSHNTLGIPACTAGQPGHCALIAFQYDPKTGTYQCRGQQYATGGDDKTMPHTPWFFGDLIRRTRVRKGVSKVYYTRKPMVYHQSVAWAVNYGMRAYLDSMMAHAVFRLLTEADRTTGGVALLESGLAINPYNFALVDAAQDTLDSPRGQIRFWQAFTTILQAHAGKAGCPTEGLYTRTVKGHLFAKIAKLPVPSDKQAAREILAFLEAEKCTVPEALVAYRLALDGLAALLSRTRRDFESHLRAVHGTASPRGDSDAPAMAATIRSVAACIKDKKQRRQWAVDLWKLVEGRELYFGRGYRVSLHPAVPVLARLAGVKVPAEAELVKPLLERVASELDKSLAGQRNVTDCRVLAARIKAAAGRLKDPQQKRQWLEGLSKKTAGKETFRPANARKNAKAVRDPCAAVISQLLKSLPKPPS